MKEYFERQLTTYDEANMPTGMMVYFIMYTYTNDKKIITVKSTVHPFYKELADKTFVGFYPEFATQKGLPIFEIRETN